MPNNTKVAITLLKALSIYFSLCAFNVQADSLVKSVVYGHKDGTAMYYDVETPENTNGKAIIFVVSSRWRSDKESLNISKPFWEVLLSEGYTLFELYHPSMPTYKIPQAYEGAKSGLAHILKHASTYGVTTNKLGILGISSGGHLALLLSMDAAADLSFANYIGAVVAIMPPVEITIKEFGGNIYGDSPVDFDPDLIPQVSPVNFVSPANAPTLLIHGTNDTTVAFERHSARLHRMLENAGVATELVPINSGHQIYPKPEMKKTHSAMLNWFERYLE